MSFHMDVKAERILENGACDAKLVNVEQIQTKFGDQLMWTFALRRGSSRGEESKVTSSRRKTS